MSWLMGGPLGNYSPEKIHSKLIDPPRILQSFHFPEFCEIIRPVKPTPDSFLSLFKWQSSAPPK
jgi:hypothetical protein